MALNDYMYPIRSTQPSCIILPALTAIFEIKSGMIQMFSVFHGLTNENPYQHVSEFEGICGTMKYNQMMEESLKLKLFPSPKRKKPKLSFILSSLVQSPLV